MRSLFAATLGIALAAGAALAGAAAADEIVLRANQNGRYVVATGTGLAAEADARNALRLEVVRLEGRNIAFRDVASGTYVRASATAPLSVGSPYIRGWETFELVRLAGDAVALRSVENGRYVRVGINADNRLAAVSLDPREWEMFRIEAAPPPPPPPPPPPVVERPRLDLEGEWRITEIATRDGFREVPHKIAAETVLNVRPDGTIRATAGCNRIRGTLRQNGDNVRFRELSTTKRACENPMARVERQIEEALRQADKVSGTRRELQLSEGRKILMTLRRR